MAFAREWPKPAPIPVVQDEFRAHQIRHGLVAPCAGAVAGDAFGGPHFSAARGGRLIDDVFIQGAYVGTRHPRRTSAAAPAPRPPRPTAGGGVELLYRDAR